jgi:hypothetical protein
LSHPTSGAKVISPQRHVKIQAALKREARLLGYVFLLLHFKAECVFLFLRIKLTALMARAEFERGLNKLIARA